jgi:ABC-type transport system, involved in lipoprotein release, permease component
MKVFRRVKQNWQWFLINVTGLSIAVACSLIIILYTLQQMGYDRFHSKADYIYRITLESNQGASSIHPARVYGDLRQMVTDYPVIERMVRLVPFRNAIVKIGDQKFYSRNAFLTDSSFFKVFDFKVISGNSKRAFSQPGRVFISRTLAIKYFGTLDVIGKEISILHQQDPNFKIFTIDGVMEDFPVNSHFHADLLSSFTSKDDLTTWAYTYFLIKKGTDINALRGNLQQKMESENKSGNPAPVIYLQKLTDIHLFSHKSREIENNGEIRSIVLLVSGTIIIIFIALINFFNLSRVQFISRLKSIKVKLINGASREILAGETALESLLLSALSILVGLVIAISLSRHLGISILDPDRIVLVFLVALGFIFSIALLSVLPLFTSKIVNDIKVTSRQENLYTYPLLIQFTLAVIAIAATIVLNRQMDYVNKQHPASQNANMIVIPDNPWESVQRYEVFKNELHNSTSITAVTAAMEDPGSDILDAVDFEMEGIEKKEGQSINIFTTDSNFFSSLGIRPIAGTTELGFTPSQKWESDAVELSQLRGNKNADKQKLAELEKRVGGYREKYILNQSALKMMGIYNPEEAIGKRFRLNFFLPDLFPEGEIVGVVPDFHYTNLHSKEKPLVIAPRKMFNYCFIISIDPKQRGKAIAKITSAWQKINPEIPLQYEFITDTYRKVYAGEYSQTHVLSLFALISIILSALGIFAMAAFSMQHRVKEIGIRKVNGAKVFEILALINKDFVKWIAIAFVIATPVAYFTMRIWLQNFAYKTELSWWIFAVAGLIALGIALLTVSWQSWRAATRNPVEALRYE